MEKHRSVLAWEKWREQDEGKRCIEEPGAEGQYLENRLHRAFMDGWNLSWTACEQNILEDIAKEK